MVISYIEENYLKAIFVLCQRSKEGAYTNDIAHELGITAGTVSETLKKLSDKQVIHYSRYRAVTLTDKGKEIAVQTIRRQRLWEVFLVEKLKFRWDEIHPMAEELEHIRFDELTDRLEEFLGSPKTDPHGDPIPDRKGKIKAIKSKKLTEIELLQPVVMTGIEIHTQAFLQHLDKLGIRLGVKLTLLEQMEFDKSLLVRVNQGKEVYISQELAKNILVTV